MKYWMTFVRISISPFVLILILNSRFLLNLPDEELNSMSRLGFQIEQAYWFYEDFYRTANPSVLPKLTLKTFAPHLLQRLPSTISFPMDPNDAEGLIDYFYEYKAQVPTCGAIIINEDLTKVLMVKGWTSKSTWGFPKGKIAKDEAPMECSIREVLEEIGFDISDRIKEHDFIQIEGGNNSQTVRLYLIPLVSEETQFAPRTRREIREIMWHRLDQIKYNKQPNGPKYFNVMPFMDKLKKWIKNYRKMHKIQLPKSSPQGQSLPQLDTPSLSIYDPPVEAEPHCNVLLERIRASMRPLETFTLDCASLVQSFRSIYGNGHDQGFPKVRNKV